MTNQFLMSNENTHSKAAAFQCGFDSSAAVGQLLSDDAPGQNIQAQAADVLWNVTVEQTNCVRLLDDVPWIFTCFVVYRSIRHDFLACEFARDLLELLLVVAQFK